MKGFTFSITDKCEVCDGPCAHGEVGRRGLNLCPACSRSLDRLDDCTVGGAIRWAARMARKFERRRKKASGR